MLKIIKEIIASIFYIVPNSTRVEKVVLESASYNIKSIRCRKNDKSSTVRHKKISKICRIPNDILMSHDYSNIYQIFKNITNKLSKEELSIYLTGSYGSCDYITNWSDLDIVVVIKSTQSEQLKRIYSILYSQQKYLYIDDVFQHHGFLVLHEDDYFDEKRFFPFEILENGFCLFGEETIEYYPTKGNVDFSYFKEFFNSVDYEGINDLYTFKNYIHQITLFPTLYYQSLGEVLYKPEAISRFVSDFPEFRDCFTCTSRIRYDWPSSKILRCIKTNNILFKRSLMQLSSLVMKNEVRKLRTRYNGLSKGKDLVRLCDEL